MNKDKNNQKENSCYRSIIENNTQHSLCFWERAVLVIEAEHIAENRECITFQDFRAESKYLCGNLEEYLLSNSEKNSIALVEQEIEHFYKKLYGENGKGGVYGKVRNYLSHIAHKNITIDEDVSEKLYNCYHLAFKKKNNKQQEKKQKRNPDHYSALVFLQEKDWNLSYCDFFKNGYFTLLGLLCFLCLGLEKDRAYALRDRFAFTNKNKADNKNIAEALDAIIKQYGSKKSDKMKAHKKVGEQYSSWGDKQKEEERDWNLIVNILDHVRKPIEDSPNYEQSEKKEVNQKKDKNKLDENHKRSSNSYIVDNFIIHWIIQKTQEKDNTLKKLQFAKTKIEKRKKLINVPTFNSDNKGDYFRINDQYWCRICSKDTYIDFKLHRMHLLRLARKILKGEESKNIVESIIVDIHSMQEFNNENESIISSLPRCAKNTNFAPIEEKIEHRLDKYKKISKKSEAIHLILWGLQRVLQDTKELELTPQEYQKLSAMLHYYSGSDTHQFQTKVQNAIPERYKQCEKYIKPSLAQTVECVVKKLQESLEEDRQNLIDREESFYKKHGFKYENPKKEKHPFWEKKEKNDPKKYENDHRNIVWLSKQWGKSEKEEYINRTKNIQFDSNNYHKSLKIEEGHTTLTIESGISKEEKQKVYKAAEQYAKDRLLLEIAFDLMEEYTYTDEKYPYNSFSIEPMDDKEIVKMSDFKITIKGENDEKFCLPMRYLAKLSYVFYKKNLIQGLSYSKKKYKNEDNPMEYFIQVLIPCFKEFSRQVLQILFHIESKLLEKMDKEKKKQLMKSQGFIKFSKEENNKKEKKYKEEEEKENFAIYYLKREQKDKEILTKIRNNVAHEDYKYLWEKKEEYINTIDSAAKQLGIKRTLSDIIKAAEDRKKEKKKTTIKQNQKKQ